MITKINIEEIDQIIELWYNSNIDTYNFIDEKHFDNIKENVRNKFKTKYNNIYIYKENNIIKAFFLIEDDYIDELYVNRIYRNQGIGTKIIDYLKENNHVLTLNIFKKNTKGINFYLKKGFKIIEENIEDSTKEEGYFMKWGK